MIIQKIIYIHLLKRLMQLNFNLIQIFLLIPLKIMKRLNQKVKDYKTKEEGNHQNDNSKLLFS